MYKVAIRKNDTGEVRIRTEDLEWREGSLFWWTEGNFACDCNRAMEFARAGGEDADPEDPQWECCNKYYSVLYAELEDGTRVEIDEEEEIVND